MIPRVLSAFSGTPGLVVKIALLAILNAFAIWAMYVLITRNHWIAVAVLALATAGIDLVYLAPRRSTLPLKFLIPGTIFLVAFQVIPILYTFQVAFTNYSTGHIITKCGRDHADQAELAAAAGRTAGRTRWRSRATRAASSS